MLQWSALMSLWIIDLNPELQVQLRYNRFPGSQLKDGQSNSV